MDSAFQSFSERTFYCSNRRERLVEWKPHFAQHRYKTVHLIYIHLSYDAVCLYRQKNSIETIHLLWASLQYIVCSLECILIINNECKNNANNSACLTYVSNTQAQAHSHILFNSIFSLLHKSIILRAKGARAPLGKSMRVGRNTCLCI